LHRWSAVAVEPGNVTFAGDCTEEWRMAGSRQPRPTWPRLTSGASCRPCSSADRPVWRYDVAHTPHTGLSHALASLVSPPCAWESVGTGTPSHHAHHIARVSQKQRARRRALNPLSLAPRPSLISCQLITEEIMRFTSSFAALLLPSSSS
jgi:hypothetical protein